MLGSESPKGAAAARWRGSFGGRSLEQESPEDGVPGTDPAGTTSHTAQLPGPPTTTRHLTTSSPSDAEFEQLYHTWCRRIKMCWPDKRESEIQAQAMEHALKVGGGLP
jgi:hypothetical protein